MSQKLIREDVFKKSIQTILNIIKNKDDIFTAEETFEIFILYAINILNYYKDSILLQYRDQCTMN